MTLHIRLIDLCLKAVADMSVLYLRIMASYVTISQTLCGIFTEKCPKHCPNFFGFFHRISHKKKFRRHIVRKFTEISQTLSNFFCFLHRISQKILSNFIWFVLLLIVVTITCISDIIFQDRLLGYGNHFCRHRLRVF